MHIDKTANPAFRVAIRFIFSPARPDSTGFSGQSKLVEPAARRCEGFPSHQKKPGRDFRSPPDSPLSPDRAGSIDAPNPRADKRR
jgi:hypothetical protein